jgi:hypothetical protein
MPGHVGQAGIWVRHGLGRESEQLANEVRCISFGQPSHSPVTSGADLAVIRLSH